MANYATALGRRLELCDADLQALHRGGFLHDIGLLAISEGVLHTMERLTPEEYELVCARRTSAFRRVTAAEVKTEVRRRLYAPLPVQGAYLRPVAAVGGGREGARV
jgi:response regulator RpfG family c-di-GMP phosphodiesterase